MFTVFFFKVLLCNEILISHLSSINRILIVLQGHVILYSTLDNIEYFVQKPYNIYWYKIFILLCVLIGDFFFLFLQ